MKIVRLHNRDDMLDDYARSQPTRRAAAARL
jgi:hypothetical protein